MTTFRCSNGHTFHVNGDPQPGHPPIVANDGDGDPSPIPFCGLCLKDRLAGCGVVVRVPEPTPLERLIERLDLLVNDHDNMNEGQHDHICPDVVKALADEFRGKE